MKAVLHVVLGHRDPLAHQRIALSATVKGVEVVFKKTQSSASKRDSIRWQSHLEDSAAALVWAIFFVRFCFYLQLRTLAFGAFEFPQGPSTPNGGYLPETILRFLIYRSPT